MRLSRSDQQRSVHSRILPARGHRLLLATGAIAIAFVATPAFAQCAAPAPDPTIQPPAANTAQNAAGQARAQPVTTETVVVQSQDIVKVTPSLFHVGKPIVITLAGRHQLRGACLDGTERLTKTAARVIGETTEVTVTIPTTTIRPAGEWPGAHDVLLELSKDEGRTLEEATIRSQFAVQLTKVEIVKLTKDEQTKRLRLVGSGFVPAYADQYRVKTGERLLSICWDGTKCANSNAYSGRMFANEIILGGIGPTHDMSQPFVVCHDDGACSPPGPSLETAGADRWFVGTIAAIITALAAALVFFLGSRVGGRAFGVDYEWSMLLLDRETMTYSLSKLQFYIWTMVAIFSYTYLFVSRFWYQSWGDIPPIPAGLPGIVGIAGGAAVGAQVVTKVNGPKGSGALHPAVGDLITTGGVVAAERVQFLVWTIIGAAGFVIATTQIDPRTLVELPAVPESILAISGVSAFGYLGGKLARNAGPVINEVIVGTGPDPDLVVAPQGGAASQMSAAAAAGAAEAVRAARAKLTAIGLTQAIQAVITQANAAITAAEAAVTAARPAAGVAVNRQDIEAQQTRIETAVLAATQAASAVKSQAGIPAGDVTAAESARNAANDAAKAIDDLLVALGTSATGPAGAGSPAGTKFAILELRGRNLSQDATFHISKLAESASGDVKITFDMLEPAPDDEDETNRQTPRIVARDDDAGTDKTLAKHLRLVIRLNDSVAPLFQVGKEHTVIVRNPDSQSVAYKYNVK